MGPSMLGALAIGAVATMDPVVVEESSRHTAIVFSTSASRSPAVSVCTSGDAAPAFPPITHITEGTARITDGTIGYPDVHDRIAPLEHLVHGLGLIAPEHLLPLSYHRGALCAPGGSYARHLPWRLRTQRQSKPRSRSFPPFCLGFRGLFYHAPAFRVDLCVVPPVMRLSQGKFLWLLTSCFIKANFFPSVSLSIQPHTNGLLRQTR
jgi:hypothetical protein